MERTVHVGWSIWKCDASDSGLVIPESAENSGMAVRAGIVKGKLSKLLLSCQKTGDDLEGYI